MLELIEGLPGNIVGIAVSGRLTREDCQDILVPAIAKSLKRHDKIRLYYEIGSRFPGATWEDLRLGVGNIPQWERVALVTDVGWFRHTVNPMWSLIPGEVRGFTTTDAYQGCAWISS